MMKSSNELAWESKISPDRDWITFKEAAEYIGCKENYLRLHKDELKVNVAEGKVFLLYRPFVSDLRTQARSFQDPWKGITPGILYSAIRSISHYGWRKREIPRRTWKTVQELAEEYGMCKATIYTGCLQKEIPHDESGKFHFIHEEVFLSWAYNRKYAN